MVTFAEWLNTKWNQIQAVLETWYTALIVLAQEGLGGIITRIQNVRDAAWSWVEDRYNDAVAYVNQKRDEITTAYQAVDDWLGTVIQDARNEALGHVDNLRNELNPYINNLHQNAVDWASGLHDTAMDWINDTAADIRLTYDNAVGEVWGNLTAVWGEIGKDQNTLYEIFGPNLESLSLHVDGFIGTWQDNLTAFFDNPAEYIWARLTQTLYTKLENWLAEQMGDNQ